MNTGLMNYSDVALSGNHRPVFVPDRLVRQSNHLSGQASAYESGQSEHETQRRLSQSALLSGITERLLRAAGIRKGMRVLDLGCGAGDVSVMAAALVGSTGCVLGVDQDPKAVTIAKRRAARAGLHQTAFLAAPIDTLEDLGPFDAVIGRYILHHLADPAATVRRVAGLLSPGGVIAFHEIAANIPPQSFPEIPVLREAGSWLLELFRRGGAQYDAGSRMVEIFVEAGLPVPRMFEESIVGGGPGSPIYQWLGAALRSLAPKIIELGIATEQEMRIDSFEQRLEQAAVLLNSQIVSSPQFCAWARK